MSFGWSAGDIATAVKTVYNIYEALDSCRGAPKEYREAVSFLRELTRTLGPLETLAAWKAYPEYGKDIGKQVESIKGPVNDFLQTVLKYEPSLGAEAKSGHQRHIYRKLKWHFFISKEVLALQRTIQSHMRVLDSLLQRLTLDVVYATKQSMPDIWLAVFHETIRPELVTMLQDALPGGDTNSNPNVDMASDLYDNLLSQISDLKQIADDSKAMQLRLEACLSDKRLVNAQLDQSPKQNESASPGSHKEVDTESLCKIYYVVLLYLGQFLKNLFLLLSRLVQPSRQLVPVLIAKYNITFLDGMGSPSRVLPYEFFRNFKAPFIQEEFKGVPLIDRGRYLLLSMMNNRVLDKRNWRRNMSPGSTIGLSAHLRMRKSLDFSHTHDSQTEQCPKGSCNGTWTRPKAPAWVTCPVCRRDVLSAELGAKAQISTTEVPDNGVPLGQFPERPGTNDDSPSHRRVKSNPEDEGLGEDDPDTNDEDISVFKRIVRQFYRTHWPDGSHWCERILSLPLSSRTPFNDQLLSKSYGPHIPLDTAIIPADARVLLMRHFNDRQLSLTIYIDPRDMCPYLILRMTHVGTPWYSVRGCHEICVDRDGSCLQLWRWSTIEQCAKLWARLCFTAWEELVLLHHCLASLKAGSALTIEVAPEDKVLGGERKLFQARTIDDGFVHSLSVHEDTMTKGLRLLAAVWNGELRQCPVWTAFITDQSASPTWVKRVSKTRVHLCDIQVYVFRGEYRQESQRRGNAAAFEIHFVSEEAARRFKGLFAPTPPQKVTKSMTE
ncbi:hypothetical protein NM208_g6767 [Fusarium decemcellulare]|uniref:Uncharacterized protein n=1 Tax=Fusarium decemcellulare TaxID=57161 RepID=A0ACC1SBY5_9HYPO|nr:hypothetical protein NM208_g6767 [Fusarium decemcellulare]